MNDLRKRATVKLIPRIDLQAMAAKFVMRIVYPMLSSFCLLVMVINVINIFPEPPFNFLIDDC